MDQVNNVSQFLQCIIVFALFGGMYGGLMFIQSIFFSKPDSYQVTFDEQRKQFDKEFAQNVRAEAIEELNSTYTPVTNEPMTLFDTEMCEIILQDKIHGTHGG